MSTNNSASLGEPSPGRGDRTYVIVLFISASLHGFMAAGIMLMLSQFHIQKDRLPRTIELISFPIMQKQRQIPAPPQRVALPASRPSPSRELTAPAAQPLPQISAAPETAPAQFSVPVAPVHEESAQPDAQSTNPGSGPPGEKRSDVVEIGSAKTLDNVDYSPLYNPKPAYPLLALRAGLQGFVDVDLVINEFGRVEEFSIVKVEGHPDFGNETAKIIGKWRFPPPRINGKKVKIRYLYTVNFRLE
jgi:periplasmic protein TonB